MNIGICRQVDMFGLIVRACFNGSILISLKKVLLSSFAVL